MPLSSTSSKLSTIPSLLVSVPPASTISGIPSLSESKSRLFGCPSLSESVVPSIASGIPSLSASPSKVSGIPSLSKSVAVLICKLKSLIQPNSGARCKKNTASRTLIEGSKLDISIVFVPSP